MLRQLSILALFFTVTVANADSLGGASSITPPSSNLNGPVYAPGSATGRSVGARAGDVFNVKDYGAVGDGALTSGQPTHTVSNTLGITTLAALQNYSVNGSKPYANIGVFPYGNYSMLETMQTINQGSNTIPFYSTFTVGGPSYTGPVPPNSTFIPIGTTGAPAWIASHSYAVGATASDINGGYSRLYTVTTAGTSGTTSSPTGTGTSISDGSVIWTYTGPNYQSLGMANLKPNMQCQQADIINTPPLWITAYQNVVQTVNPAASVLQMQFPTSSGNFNVNSTTDTPINTNTITLANTNGVTIGGGVARIYAIALGATVTAINGNTVTISANTLADIPSGTAIQFTGVSLKQGMQFTCGYNLAPNGFSSNVGTSVRVGAQVSGYAGLGLFPQINTSAAQSAAGTTLDHLPNVTGVLVGDIVTGTNIPNNTTVTAVGTTSVTLSNPTTTPVPNNTTITFTGPTTVTSVNNNPGNESVSLSRNLNFGAGATSQYPFAHYEFWSPWTDTQIANESMDTLGIQAATIAADHYNRPSNSSFLGGNTVTIPAGTYELNLGIVKNGTEIDPGSPVNFEGAGSGATHVAGNTYLNWTVDLGSGGYYFLAGGFRESVNGAANVSKLAFNGSNNGFALPGESLNNTIGLGINGYSHVTDVVVQNTFADMAINGGQNNLNHVQLGLSYYGIYYDTNSNAQFGDTIYESTLLGPSQMANVAASIFYEDPAASWFRSLFSAAPYGYTLETYGANENICCGSNNVGLFLDYTKFENQQCEGVGFTCFGPDRPYGQDISTSNGIIWEEFEPCTQVACPYALQWQIPYKTVSGNPVSFPAGAIFEMANCNDCEINIPSNSFAWSGQGSIDGVIDIQSTGQGGFKFIGDLNVILGVNQYYPFLSQGVTAGYYNTSVNNVGMNPANWYFISSGWEGRALYAHGAFAAGTILAVPPGGGTIGTSLGAAGESVVGVSIGGVSSNQIYATCGLIGVTVPNATPLTNSYQQMRTTVSTGSDGKQGTATPTTGSNETTSPYIGWADYGAGAYGTVPVHLRLGGC